MPAIAKFYAGRSVFVTGGTGFIGKVLVEKLLRSCPDIGQIYLLMRPKKGVAAQSRLKEVIKSPAFDRLRRSQPSFERKVVPILGDIDQEGLGLSDADYTRVTNNAQVVIHSAATLSFTEPLDVAVKLNVIGSRRVLQLGKALKSCDSFVYISTAYVNMHLSYVDEVVHEPVLTPSEAMELIKTLSPVELEVKTRELLLAGNRVNTYVLTKGITEKMLVDEREHVPLCITRPSVVGAALKEPLTGFMDGRSGWTGMMVGAGTATFKYMPATCANTYLDLVPVDYVVRGIIAAGWNTALRKEQKKDDVLVYHLTAGNEEGMRANFRTLTKESTKAIKAYPLDNLPIKPYFGIASKTYISLYNTFVHEPACHLFDIFLRAKGKKPYMVRFYRESVVMLEGLERFMHLKAEFRQNNLVTLQNSMDASDKQEFAYSMRNFDFSSYLRDYWLGIRRHVFRLPKETVKPEASETLKNMNTESHTTTG